MKIHLLYIIILLSHFLLCCNNSNHSVKCLQIEQPLKGDTLVFNNNMDGLEIENFNFILATEKYLQGITDEQMDLKLWVEIYTQLDSSKRKVDAYVLKSNKSNENFIDFVSWIQNENPTKPNDRSKPYIIHPITGKLNRIKDGIVIRKKVEDFHAEKLLENAEEISEWNEYQWDENSIVNFSVDYWNGKRITYYGNCSVNIPNTISKTLTSFGIIQNMLNRE